GVAPKLPLSAEVIRRHAGNDAWPVILVQQEQLRVSPDVARIRRDKKWQVANQAYAIIVRVFLEPVALAEQQELTEANLVNPVRFFASNLVERSRLALHDRGRPRMVIRSAELALL